MLQAHACGMRYAVVDVETTGFSPATDRVVEAACVLIEDLQIAGTWSSLVNPGREIPPYASAVHGIYDADVAGAPSFASVTANLQWLCAGSTIVAHNAAFDVGFLPMLAYRPWICTVRLARRFFPNAPNFKNQTLRAYLGIDVDPAFRHLKAHRALGDALVTAAIFLRCMERFEAPVMRPA